MRKPYKRVTQEEKDKMIAMYQEDKTFREIAETLGRSSALVWQQLNKPSERIFQFKVFTPEEIALIKECFDTGGSVSYLAKKIKCNPATIQAYAMRARLDMQKKESRMSAEMEKRLDAVMGEFMESDPLGSSWNFEEGL